MKHLMIDIEALGLEPGCAIFELAGVVFDLETGETGAEFRAAIHPDHGFAEQDTVDWHKARGTFPMPGAEARETAMVALDRFAAWYAEQGSPGTIWSWGSTYDFPILQAVWRTDATASFPWRYHRASCARTVWKLAFPDVKHDPRPHKALEDCHAAIKDLCKAHRHLTGTAALGGVTLDARRYHRLRVLGCAVYGTPHLDAGNVMRFTTLDNHLDHDLALLESRGEFNPAQPS